LTFTRPLAELRRSDAAEFGGKSANLGELLAAGIPVPPGFAIRANASLESIRSELEQRYDELGRPPVAVRSSALGEDSAEASHAGQQESFLWVRGIDKVFDAVRDCRASLHSERAVSYRDTLGVDASAMGVTVQLMVDAAASGVMFTCNPVSGDPSMVAVNASWGLGLAVVGGEVTPDDYLVSKVTCEVVRRTVSDKHHEYVAGDDGPVRVDVPADRRSTPCLEAPQLAALVDVAKRVERHFGCHQDIEWAIARDGGLHVLQTRPVTVQKTAPKLSGSALSLVMQTFGAD
jgi:phosphoenolpyruvate synthase/pyruvate phosphate dikinase